MDFFENRYYNATRICLSLIGLWPYTAPRTKLIRVIFINVIVISMLIAQIITIISLELNDNDLIIEVLVNFCISLCIIAMYYNILFNMSKVHKLLNNIRNDWLENEGMKEFEVMKEYAEKCRIFSFACLATYYFAVSSIILLSTLPFILDTFKPLNETRIRTLPFPIKLFIDEQKNYGLLALLSCIVVSIIGLAVVSGYSLFMILMQHLCGMFYVIGNMLESAFHSKIPIANVYLENEYYAKIVLSVKYHKRALEFDAGVNSLYEISFFVLMIIGAVTLVFQFLRVLQTDSFESGHLKRTILMILHIFTNVSILFMKCHLGQKIIDHSTLLFDKAFDTPWYTLSKRSRMLIWFIMARSMKPSYISIGNSFILSVKFFASMVQTSLSYAMVVYSVR